MDLMVGISGIRGIIGESLLPETIIKYVSAYAEFCNKGKIIIGRDGRITGKSLTDIAISTLLQMGCDVIDLDICPTPTVGLAIEKLGANGGIAITASHNPIMWNGLKFFSSTGLFLNSKENNILWRIAEQKQRYSTWNRQGKYNYYPEFIDAHINEAFKLPYIDLRKIKNSKFKIVIDCINSAGSLVIPKLLKQLGCKTIELNCDTKGIFRHAPEPIPENLISLRKEIRKHKADLGIAVDPDVDRLVLIDEKGKPYGEEYTITTCAKFILGKTFERKIQNKSQRLKYPKVVVNLSTTRAVEDICKQYNASIYRTPVGEIYVASKMKEIGAIIGGEGNGGVILPAVHYNRDAIVGIVLILQYLSEFGGTLSELKSTLPEYYIVKGKIDIRNLRADNIIRNIRKRYAHLGKINYEDGLKIDFPDGWVHLRKSNTEPIIRIIAEATTKLKAEELIKKFTNEITYT